MPPSIPELGAIPLDDGRARFTVWAPRRRVVEVMLDSGTFPLERGEGGYFRGTVRAPPGTRYRFRLDGGEAFPDPASRFQPEGPHGPSQVVDPSRFPWTDASWRGPALEGQVLYEIHIGAFSPEGTWQAAARELPELADLGVTAVEVMPVADFPGEFGWGYDGVGLFAPVALYGTPDDFRAFVDRAHALGLAVVLDVVYNHVGPDGSYLARYSEDYFTGRYTNPWGRAVNYDGDNSAAVREWVAANAAYWAAEFHIDGLRLDATDQIFDSSPEHIVTSLARSMRAAAAGRRTFIVAENEARDARLARPSERGGYGLDALWNDDFHHAARVALTGRKEACFRDFRGTPQELLSAAKHGFLFQGQRSRHAAGRRGTSARDLHPARFVNYLENHDQTSNAPRGARIHQLASPGDYRALTALLLLAPGTPLLFQGQEFASSSPFCFFAAHREPLRARVREGRFRYLARVASLPESEVPAYYPDPGDRSAFDRAKLDFAERQSHAGLYRMHKDLLRLRREDGVIPGQRPGAVDGAVLSNAAFALRFFGAPVPGDRLLLVNLGPEIRAEAIPEPLLAPPDAFGWELLWSSEDPRYGGSGTPPPESPEGWRIPAHAAVVLRPAGNGQRGY